MSPNHSQRTRQRASKKCKDYREAAQRYIDTVYKTTPNATGELDDILKCFDNTFTSIRGAIIQIMGGAATAPTDQAERNAGVTLVKPENDSGGTLGDDDDELCDYVVVDMTEELQGSKKQRSSRVITG